MFGLEINKDVVRRVLANHYQPSGVGGSPSWLTFIGQSKDSLWSVDLFRCESILMKSHWVMIAAQQALDEWIKKAAASNVNMLKQFSKTLAVHRSGILAYFDFDGLSTGPLEGTNNKIKTLHKMAYGFRDIEFFKLKIMALHETNYVLVGGA